MYVVTIAAAIERKKKKNKQKKMGTNISKNLEKNAFIKTTKFDAERRNHGFGRDQIPNYYQCSLEEVRLRDRGTEQELGTDEATWKCVDPDARYITFFLR